MPSITPQRMTVGNLETGESLVAQYNPKQVEVAIAATWNKATIPGQTYQEQQYAYTGNPTIALDLVFDGLGANAPDLLDVEGFLFSLMYAPLNPGTVSTGAPPRVLLSWPGWILLVTSMPKITQTTTRFAPEGKPTYQSYKIEFEQRLTRRIGGDEVRRSALRRAA